MRHVRPSYLVASPSAHPLVRDKLFPLMRKEQITVSDLAQRSGVKRVTIAAWKRRNTPNVANLEACFNVLGYTLQPIRKKETTE